MRRILLALILCTSAYAQTAHFNASDNDHVFTTAGNPPTGTITDGAEMAEWSAESGDLACDETGGAGFGPLWRSTSPGLLLPVLDFDGTNDSCRLETDAGTDLAPSDFIAADQFVVIAAVRFDALPDTNEANPYNNEGIIAGSTSFWGIHAKNDSGLKFVFYNWDGNADSIELAGAIDTNYVLMYRHAGGNILASLNCGSETSIASGNTTDLTGLVFLGLNNTTDLDYASMRIGRIKVWNTGTAGGTHATECASMYNDFVVASTTATPVTFVNLNGQ